MIVGHHKQDNCPVCNTKRMDPFSVCEFITHDIVSDVVDDVPMSPLEVKYGDLRVFMGNIVTPTEVNKKPTVVNWNGNPNKYHLLIMTDPDSPTRSIKSFGEWQHWIVGNIEGMDISTGEVLSSYIPPIPPKGSKLHRYVFLVYEQHKRVNFRESKLSSTCGHDRALFSTREFIKKYFIGRLVAGNFFRAEWDKSVSKTFEILNQDLKTALLEEDTKSEVKSEVILHERRYEQQHYEDAENA